MASVARRLRARAALTRQERAALEADALKFKMSGPQAVRSFLKFRQSAETKAEDSRDPLFGFSKR